MRTLNINHRKHYYCIAGAWLYIPAKHYNKSPKPFGRDIVMSKTGRLKMDKKLHDVNDAKKQKDKVMNSLFDELKKLHSLDKIAENLGLHSNTVERWVKLNSVPKHYFYDFNRLLGKDVSGESISGDQAKDKDQYFTKPEVAVRCVETFKRVAAELGVDLSDYWFVEPSVGYGDFYKLMPPRRRIGVDLDPKPEVREWSIIKSDFLNWRPPEGKKYILMGNPPFGLRGHVALQFINHALPFCDMIAFILPPLFNSDGKGVPQKRVKEYVLAHSEKLPPKSFQYPDGRDVEVHTIFQIWTKVGVDKVKIKTRKTCKDFISIYSLSNGGTPSSTRNKDMIGKCDVYLPSTCFDGMKAYNSFNELPNQRGYGIVIKQNKSQIKNTLTNTDWTKIGFKSTNSAINLRSSIIEDVITASGFCDEPENIP